MNAKHISRLAHRQPSAHRDRLLRAAVRVSLAAGPVTYILLETAGTKSP